MPRMKVNGCYISRATAILSESCSSKLNEANADREKIIVYIRKGEQNKCKIICSGVNIVPEYLSDSFSDLLK